MTLPIEVEAIFPPRLFTNLPRRRGVLETNRTTMNQLAMETEQSAGTVSTLKRIGISQPHEAKHRPAASLIRRFTQSPVDALIDIKVGCRLRRQIPVRLDLDTLARLRITVARKAMRKDAAFQIFAKRLAHKGARCVMVALAVELACAGQLKPCHEMLTDGLVQQRSLGVARVVKRPLRSACSSRLRQ